MATIKSYTDIEQSRKLAKILEVYTADCYYPVTYIEESTNKYLMCYIKPYIGRLSEVEGSVDTRLYIPCWSLAALLDILPDNYIDFDDTIKHPSLIKTKDSRYMVIYSAFQYTSLYNNPIDACIEMIEKLHELNLL